MKICHTSLHQKRPKSLSKARWKDGVENDVRKMLAVNWREVAQDRDGWSTAARERLTFWIVEQNKIRRKMKKKQYSKHQFALQA
jgi:DNA polymerase III delta prime subunit